MKNNKLFESAGMLLTETEDDQIYGARVAADALEDDAFIEGDKQLSAEVAMKVSELLERYKAFKDEVRELWDNNQDSLVMYGKDGGTEELYTIYAAAFGNLDYDSTEKFYDEYS